MHIGDSGADVVDSTPRELGALVAKVVDKYATPIRAATIRPGCKALPIFKNNCLRTHTP
jgi:hypothetical protein